MQLIFHHSFPYDFDRFCCVLAEIVTCHFSTHCLGTGKIVFLSALLTEPCHSKKCFIHDHTGTIKNNIIYYISVSNLKYMFFNIKYRMYFENTVVQ